MIYMEHPAKKRYFMLVLEQDMFGSWLLKLLYGGLDNHGHGSKVEMFECEKTAREMMFNHENTRRQKGYMYAQYPLEFIFDLIPQTVEEVATPEVGDIIVEKTIVDKNLIDEFYHVNDQLQFGFN